MVKSFFSLQDFDFKNKVVLVRVDFNVPINKGKVVDDKRIKAVIPTIRFLQKNNAKIVLMSHLGRPDGKIVEEFKLKNVGKRLEKLLKSKIVIVDDCIGPKVKDKISKLKPKQILLLENLRFYKEEEKEDKVFAKKLASLGDVFVNDAFGVSHRANSSVHSITEFLPSCAGLLLEKEIVSLSKILNPEKPFIAIMGGAKISDKIGVINNLLVKVDKLLIGGAMMFTFLKAQGLDVGKSKVEDDKLHLARQLLNHHKIILPIDVVVAKEASSKSKSKVVLVHDIPKDMMGLDIGPDSVKYFCTLLNGSKTVFWNGPLGFSEVKQFSNGTNDVAKFVSKLNATTIIGGGETGAAIERLKLSDKFSHLSTGGGAALEFVEGKRLPGIVALEESYKENKKIQ